MTSYEPAWSVGLMTGTVLDGNIDVALIRTDGERVVEFGPYTLTPYEPALLTLLEQTVQAARDWNFVGAEPEIFKIAEAALTDAQSSAVAALVAQSGLSLNDIAVVGFHGQTVLHRAPADGVLGQTRQLGDGARMARTLGIAVAYDFRTADINAGGQGAPLCPSYHAALLSELGIDGSRAVLNLGGVANITWCDAAGNIIAFDTGPANAPINDFIRMHGLGEMDRNGALAAQGTVDEARLSNLLTHPYLSAPYPKSLDRFDFSAHMANGMSPENGAALLTAFSASAVAKALDLLPQRPKQLLVCGGGRHNPVLMQTLQERAGVTVVPVEAVAWRGDAVEAECFAFLAMRAVRGLAISYPSTTGVASAMTGGVLAQL